MNTFKTSVIVVAAASLSVLALAQQAVQPAAAVPPQPAQAEASAPAPVKDYGNGFKALYRLGFPDVAKAEYVNLQAYSSRGGSTSFDSYMFEHEIKMAGNAWMLEETPKKKGMFVMGACQIREVFDSQALNKERMEEMKAQAKTNKASAVTSGFRMEQDDRYQGTWKKADAAKDAQKLLDYLRKSAKGGDERSGRYNSFRYSNAAGQAFLFAAHFYRKGLTNEANQIAAALFETAGDSKKVLVQAINVMADLRLQEINAGFFKSRDWSAYATNLEAAAATFGKTWKQGVLAQRLAGKVRQRAATPEPPPLAGEGLADEDRALAKDMAGMEDAQTLGSLRYGAGPWVLPGQDGMRRGRSMPPQAGKKDVLHRIMQRGMKSVPLLLALAKDEYMVAVDQAGGGYSSHSFSDERELTEQQLDQMYGSMSRPVTRGEIAVALLKPLLPSKDERSSSRDAWSEEVADEVGGWYKLNKDKTPLDLARAYLSEGNNTQGGVAIRYLSKKGSEEDMQAIEKHLLEADNPQEVVSMVQEYVTVRGEKAKDFLAKYEARIAAPPAGGQEDAMFKQGRNDQYMKQQIGRLKALTESTSFSSLLDSVAGGSKSLADISGPFYQQMGKTEPESALADVLAAVMKASDPKVSAQLLGLASSLKYAASRGQMMGDEPDATDETPEGPAEDMEPPKTKLQLAKSADLWRKLLNDRRPAAAGKPGTIGDLAAGIMDSLYAADGDAAMAAMSRRGMGGVPDARYVMGDKARDVYRARAEALLAGKNGADLPQFPRLDPLNDEQKKALVDRLIKVPAGDLAKAVESLTLDERVALPALGKKNDALNAKLAPLAIRVTGVTVTPPDAAWVGTLAGMKGKDLNKAAVEQMLGGARKALDDGKVVVLAASRHSRLGGIEISAQEIMPGSSEYKEMLKARMIGPSGSPEITGGVAAPGCMANATWATAEPVAKEASAPAASPDDAMLDAAVKEVEKDLAAAMVRDQDEFWKMVEAFCAGKGNVCRAGAIQFESRPVVRAAAK